MPDDTTQRRHRLALQEPTPEASGRSIPPIRSDLVGAADTHLAAKPPARLSSPPPPPPPPPPQLFRTEKQLTAPADRPVRAPAHAVAFTTAVAVGGTGPVHRRTGIKTARTLPVDRNGAGSPLATNCAQNPPPALAAIQTHCCSDHRHAWRCNADPDVDLREEGRSNDTQRTLRARGVSRGESG